MRFYFFMTCLALSFSSCISPFFVGQGIANDLNNRSNKIQKTNQEPGACYAKCQVPANTITHRYELFLFTGNPRNTEVALKEVDIITTKGESRWIKKRSDKNCRSANPDDCLVWCLVDVPEEKETYLTVVDTSTTDEYKTTIIETKESISPSTREEEWKEVICEYDITNEIVMKIQNALFAEGLYLGPLNGMMTEETKDALRNFQINNDLAFGQLDFDTLDLLGVGY